MPLHTMNRIELTLELILRVAFGQFRFGLISLDECFEDLAFSVAENFVHLLEGFIGGGVAAVRLSAQGGTVTSEWLTIGT